MSKSMKGRIVSAKRINGLLPTNWNQVPIIWPTGGVAKGDFGNGTPFKGQGGETIVETQIGIYWLREKGYSFTSQGRFGIFGWPNSGGKTPKNFGKFGGQEGRLFLFPDLKGENPGEGKPTRELSKKEGELRVKLCGGRGFPFPPPKKKFFTFPPGKIFGLGRKRKEGVSGRGKGVKEGRGLFPPGFGIYF